MQPIVTLVSTAPVVTISFSNSNPSAFDTPDRPIDRICIFFFPTGWW
jgi:hypothetical protein